MSRATRIALKAILLIATIGALTSLVGQIVLAAAPILLPGQWLAARDSGPAARVLWSFLFGVTLGFAASILALISGDTAATVALVSGLVLGWVLAYRTATTHPKTTAVAVA